MTTQFPPITNSNLQIIKHSRVPPQTSSGLLQKGPTLTLPNFARNKRIEGTPSSHNQITPTPEKSIFPLEERPPTPAVAIVDNNIDECNVRTPLIIPRIGIVKGNHNTDPILQPGENPWIISKTERSAEVKITAITPIGTIAMVPTLDTRPAPTPRHVPPPNVTTPAHTPTRHLTLQVIDEHTGDVKIDPLLTATIYLDCTPPEDQDYNYVSNKMRAISENTMSLQKQYTNQLRPLLPISGIVSHSMFDEALSVYENNQVYYQDRIDDHKLDIPTIKQKLTELEHWFMSIIEPPVKVNHKDEIDARKEREQSKITKGISSYCDPELYPYITPAGTEIKSFIAQHNN